MEDVGVGVEGLENELEIVEVVRDGFDVVDVEDENIVVELLEDDVHDADAQDEVPDAG